MTTILLWLLLLFCCCCDRRTLARDDLQFCTGHSDCIDTGFCYFQSQQQQQESYEASSSSSSILAAGVDSTTTGGICTCNPINHNGCIRGLETCDYPYDHDFRSGSGAMPTCGLENGASCAMNNNNNNNGGDSVSHCHSQYCHRTTNTCACNPQTQQGCQAANEVCVVEHSSTETPTCMVLEKRSLDVGMTCVLDSQCTTDYCFKTSNHEKVCTCNPYSNQGCHVTEQCRINRVVELELQQPQQQRVDDNNNNLPSCFTKIHDSCTSDSDCFTSNCWNNTCVCETKLHTGCDRRFEMCVGNDESGYQCVERPVEDDPLLGDDLEKSDQDDDSGAVGMNHMKAAVVIVTTTTMMMNVFIV